ncbi:MAG: protein-L-isoaspartate O-methyltransferase, partial [Planctomycetes bacterium]|nr:protein-L-isoaspartate O-methyltransferase [Planctomycetota bacterium]
MSWFKKNTDFETQRAEMVKNQLQARDIVDERVLEAFLAVERHKFIDASYHGQAYADHPVHIGCGQTISQPYVVAYMTQELRVSEGMRVLEVGTGSGYQTAILAVLGCQVYTIERHEDLTERASTILQELELDANVEFFVGDGTVGVPEEAPFDRIIVTAAAPSIPLPLK